MCNRGFSECVRHRPARRDSRRTGARVLLDRDDLVAGERNFSKVNTPLSLVVVAASLVVGVEEADPTPGCGRSPYVTLPRLSCQLRIDDLDALHDGGSFTNPAWFAEHDADQADAAEVVRHFTSASHTVGFFSDCDPTAFIASAGPCRRRVLAEEEVAL